ncbi:hypothetical protein [Microbacterium sp. Se63.02b]|uniref:hypothetical protein n=1 Tax=Microbacterium sp. Se63.02b TaxID=2709304 RepID=UPI001FCE4C8C|nr:hypothetical protein [Microbacterium sp. Se63.02b]
MGQDPLRGGARSTTLSILRIADTVREVFAAASGLDPSWFSFNSRGACPTCRGRGHITTELAFLDDVSLPCDACGGLRFNPKALGVRVDGASIADVLASTPAEARELFSAHPDVVSALDWVQRTGLSYIPVGRSLDTFSGGEKQRLLLARHLSDPRRDPADRIILDEPTSGLHPTDVDTINILFDDLLDEGATLVVVEHNLRVVSRADHVIDIGPGAGSDGGRLIFAGTPAEILRDDDSLTGKALAVASSPHS